MATSTIKNQGIDVNYLSRSSGSEIYFAHKGYICSFAAKIIKTSSSYTIFTELPIPKNAASSIITDLGDIGSLKILSMNSYGVMQIPSSSTFDDAIYVTGSYMTESWGGVNTCLLRALRSGAPHDEHDNKEKRNSNKNNIHIYSIWDRSCKRYGYSTRRLEFLDLGAGIFKWMDRLNISNDANNSDVSIFQGNRRRIRQLFSCNLHNIPMTGISERRCVA